MENELKQVLCVATPETSENYRWEKNSHLIDESRVRIVDLETIKGMEAQGITFERETAPITEGMVFGLHPYKQNCYIDLAMEESKLLEYKVNLLMKFCKHLGVTSMSFEADLSREEERELGLNGDVTYKVIKTGAEYRSEDTRKELQRYKRYEAYPGEFTTEDYEKAEQFYKEIGHNSGLEYLLRQRNPKDGNKLLSQKITIELTSEMNSLTEAGFKLTAMEGIFGLNTQFKKSCSVKRVILLNMELNFSK